MQHTSEEPLSLEELFNRIVTGQAIIRLNGKLVIVKDPSVFDRQMSDMIYQNHLDLLYEEGVPSLEDLMSLMRSVGILTPHEDHLHEALPKEILKVQEEIVACKFRSVTRSALMKKKENLEQLYKSLVRKKNSLMNISAEHLANNIKHQYLVYNLTFDTDGKRIFHDISFEEFLAKNTDLADEILAHGLYPKNIEEKDIRKLARNEPWRSVWLLAQKTGNLFGKPAIEMTDLQRSIVTWSLIYDAVRESVDCPEQDVFEDDALFDVWLNSQSKGQKRSDNKDYGPKVLKHSDLTEVGIMVESPEDARRVYEMNSAATNNNIRQNQKIISEKGEIQAGYLPEVQRLLRQKATQQAGANK